MHVWVIMLVCILFECLSRHDDGQATAAAIQLRADAEMMERQELVKEVVLHVLVGVCACVCVCVIMYVCVCFV